MSDPELLRADLLAMGLDPLLREEVWSRLERGSVRRCFPSGAVLWRAGSDAAALYLVQEGRVRIVRTRRSRQFLVHVAERGHVIGDVPVLDGTGYPATAIAATDVTCLAIPRSVVLQIIEEDGRVGRFFLERLGRRVRTLVSRLEEHTLADVRCRVAASLIGLHLEQRSSDLRLPSPQDRWAEDLGTVRETLAREISGLVRDGLVERTGRGRIRIVDERRLERVALAAPT